MDNILGLDSHSCVYENDMHFYQIIKPLPSLHIHRLNQYFHWLANYEQSTVLKLLSRVPLPFILRVSEVELLVLES